MSGTHALVDIPALKRRHPLDHVVEAAGVRLRGRGRVRQGVCPFHAEATGSFTVYADSERWYCFGCGAGGDVLDFVQRIEDLTLPEAMRRLDAGHHGPAAAAGPGGGGILGAAAPDIRAVHRAGRRAVRRDGGRARGR